METTATGILCQFHERVADRIGSNHFRAWFQPPTQLALDAERVCVVVPNSFIGNWIASNYARHLADAARALTGAEMRVEITVQATSPAGRPPVPPAAPPRNVATAAAPRPGPRRPQSVVLRGELETYVVGAGNALAFAAAERIVRSPNRAHSPIVMHGGCGLGKTHLLHGICNGVRRGHPELHWCYISGEEFTNEYIYALKAGRVDQFRARFRNVDLLVIDDIHFLQNKKATLEEFLHTLNAIDTGGRAVVLSSDRHPREIATLTEHLISRLVAGIVV
ncbi:MAG: DnaA/Hda family protein, partial [Phycisphaerae bacterium]